MPQAIDYWSQTARWKCSGWLVVIPILIASIAPIGLMFTESPGTRGFPGVLIFAAGVLFCFPNLFIAGLLCYCYRSRGALFILTALVGTASVATIGFGLYWIFIYGVC